MPANAFDPPGNLGMPSATPLGPTLQLGSSGHSNESGIAGAVARPARKTAAELNEIFDVPCPPFMRVIHLLGSAVSHYYEQLSTNYARECVESTMTDAAQDHFEFLFACVHPDGCWSFPLSLGDVDIAAAPRINNAMALSHLAGLEADVVVPHMFCYPGMTTYRSIFDLLGVPMVGCPVDAMAISTNKARTRAIIAAHGVRVARGEVLRAGENLVPTLQPPFVLKPCSEDNSMGITLVRKMSEFDDALKEALKFDTEVLVEEFIPLGRELRVGVLEDDKGGFTVLPAIEYHLHTQQPIRSSADKLCSDADGNITAFAQVERSCPADVSPDLFQKCAQQAVMAHKALGCRDYSLYDLRISPDGTPYVLEAGLYCSFAPRSIIVLMSGATGDASMQHLPLFYSLLKRAAARKTQPSSAADKDGKSVQKFGMKVR